MPFLLVRDHALLIVHAVFPILCISPSLQCINLLYFFRFNTPQLAAENWGCGGFVPPHTQIFQGEIFNIPELAPEIFYFALVYLCRQNILLNLLYFYTIFTPSLRGLSPLSYAAKDHF